MQIAVLIPEQWVRSLDPDFGSDRASAAEVCRSALAYALSQVIDDQLAATQLQEPQVDQRTAHRVAMHVPAMSLGRLLELARQHKITPGPMGKRLIGLVACGHISGYMGLRKQVPVSDSHPLAIVGAAMQSPVRPEQARFYDNVWSALTNNAVGLVEGGTGIGKTRAIIAAAARFAQERSATVAICAPTIAVLRQAVAEHQALHASGVHLPRLQLVVGRREFISQRMLESFLLGDGREWATPEVLNWARTGVDLDDDGAVDLSWQVFSLLQLCPDFPVDEVRLPEVCDTSDRGYKAYRRQFDALHVSTDGGPLPGLLLCTHAMLAQEMRRRLIVAHGDETYEAMAAFYRRALAAIKGKRRQDCPDEFDAISVLEAEVGVALNEASQGRTILPAFTALIVDEGHMLDETFAAAASSYLSLRSVLADLIAFAGAGGKITPGGVAIVGESIKRLIAAAPDVDRRDIVELGSDAEARLTPHLAAIATVCNSISAVKDRQSERYRLGLRIQRSGAIIEHAVGSGRRWAYLRHSPVRKWPQLLVTSANISTLLSRLWAAVESAAVVSATLYVPTKDGGSGSFIAGLLRIPSDRLKAFETVSAPWSVSCVQGVWRPVLGAGGSPTLLPPNASTQRSMGDDEKEADEARWHDTVAQAVRGIYETAAGGVLVLCTSYATVRALANAFAADGAAFAQALVIAKPGVAVRSQSDAFLRLSKDGGVRPMWLAVGGAWTGVDIGGHAPWRQLFGSEVPAADDCVLTDLVIPRLPFGTNQSFTHLWRIRNHPNMPWDLWDASLKFKQALGRLVRREGLPSNRRIHVLDGRLGDANYNGRLVPFERALLPYKQMNYSSNLCPDCLHQGE